MAISPEKIRRHPEHIGRWTLHNAANPAHIAARLQIQDGSWLAYKIAWVGDACFTGAICFSK